MAKPTISNVVLSGTFQDWLNVTNEMANYFKDQVITASGSGDSTTGNASLIGDFSVSNLSSTNTIFSNTFDSAGSAVIDFNAPIIINGGAPTCATFSFASGGRTRYTDGVDTWDVGMEDGTADDFIISTGTGPRKLTLSPSGVLTVPSLVVTGTVTADLGLTTADIQEDSDSLFFTDERTQAAFIAGTDVSFSAVDANGKITINVSASDATTLQGKSASQFLRSDQSGSLNGNLIVTGDITSNGSASDISLKENIKLIQNAGCKLSQLNGYTFNYIDNPDQRMTGVIAQEIEAVLPEAVYVSEIDSHGNEIKAVRYGNIIGLLIESIKELQEQIAELENDK